MSVEIDPVTYEFGKANLERLGYRDVLVVLGDGGLGFPDRTPYDRICFTAACGEVPPPLLEQLAVGGRLIGPLEEDGVQRLVLVEKRDGVRRESLCDVLYVPLQGRYAPAARRAGSCATS